MTSILTLGNYGIAKFVAAGTPGASVIGAQLNDVYCNTNDGMLFNCIDGTFGSQSWLGTDGITYGDLGIASPSHPNLIAMYTMDNISGSTLFDESPNGRDGTLAGGIITTSGLIGNALRADGIDDRVILPTIGIAQRGAWSLSCWARRSVDAVMYICSFGPQSTFGDIIQVFIGDTTRSIVTAQIFGTDVKSTDLATVPADNNWQHFVVTYSGDASFNLASCKLYHNSTLLAGTFVGSPRNPSYNDTGGLLFENADASSFSAGDLDQWRFFNRALIQSEVDALYNGGVGI